MAPRTMPLRKSPRPSRPSRAKDTPKLHARAVSDTPQRLGTSAKRVIAARLCAFVFRQGKASGRFEMALEQLVKESGQKRSVIEMALQLAETRDWIRRDGSAVILRAAGIHVAKGVLGLSR
jgi:hypothetical protein